MHAQSNKHNASPMGEDPLEMINLSDLVLDAVPLTTVEPIREEGSSTNPKKDKLSGKSSTSLNKMIPRKASKASESKQIKASRAGDSLNNSDHAKMIGTDKQIWRMLATILTEIESDDEQNVQTSSRIRTSSKGKCAHSLVSDDFILEKRSKKKADVCVPNAVINLDDSSSKDDILANHLKLGIAKRLKKRKGKGVVVGHPQADTPMNKVRDVKGKAIIGPTKSWSKVVVPSKKRKVILPMILKQSPMKMFKTSCYMEGLLCKDVEKFIEDARLSKTITGFGPCYEGFVKEFVVSVLVGYDDANSKNFRKVGVRERVVIFSPAVINEFLGRSVESRDGLEVTNDQACREIIGGQLTVKYAILHRIAVANWVPSNHTSTITAGLGRFIHAVCKRPTYNFGAHIFDQILKQAFSTTVKMPIFFPYFICGIILNQHPDIIVSSDHVKKRDSPLTLHYKLFGGAHVQDIALTYSPTSGATSPKQGVIVTLKATYRELDESLRTNTSRKIQLERLIKTLVEEENKTKQATAAAARKVVGNSGNSEDAAQNAFGGEQTKLEKVNDGDSDHSSSNDGEEEELNSAFDMDTDAEVEADTEESDGIAP
ncbi:uncharacterized protein LOC131658250 [Vicia villosa]|uniref:uncharacterized protein LOC131658250 n=1 Tax=Vicia villosa TaxID=3911 RepID=UPI00273C3D8A|nr:uncharacterized protein LOC131658250 [Vicia villosa]